MAISRIPIHTVIAMILRAAALTIFHKHIAVQLREAVGAYAALAMQVVAVLGDEVSKQPRVVPLDQYLCVSRA